VAAFLYKGEGLNKTAIGDYLGEKSDFNEAVLKAFVDLHDFTDLILVQALRQFLWSFRSLPGTFLLLHKSYRPTYLGGIRSHD
jgi:cytohesin